jgi:N-acetylmuramoyl-L-alanine amidase
MAVAMCSGGRLSILRATDESDGHSRLVVGVTGKTDYAIARTNREIVLRLAPAGTVPDIAAPLLTRRPSPPSSNQHLADSDGHGAVADGERLLGKAVVMIDPGHGGYDPGTRDPSGQFLEKNLALEISRRVAADLKARGATVEMTRDSDVFIALADRTHLANRAGADLFVSIHLNSSPNADASGIEVYYLNNTTDRAALRLARLENQGAAGYGAPDKQNLNYILSSMMQNYKADESASLARMIETQTVTELDATFNPGVNPLGARMGPFYVLVGARMPSVLVECGFLSNRAEAERLASPAYQERMAGGIASAVIHYLNSGLELGNL